jgi:Tfp pilus assembly protein PilO
MNKTYINLGLFASGALIMWMFAFPLYSGNGQNILNAKSVVEWKKELEQKNKELELAQELQKRAETETVQYNRIDTELKNKIEQMIPAKVDIPRLFNNMSILAKNSGLKLDSINYSKSANPDGIDQLNSYKITMSLSGDYLKFRDFLEDLQNSLQLYRISSIFFTSVKSTDTRNQDEDGQKFNVTFDAYEFKN